MYALEKLRQLNKEYYLQSSADTNLTIDSLVNMLASNINKEEHMNTLCHFIHYILQVAGSLQGHSIVWWVEESEELINEPFIEFNEKGFWGTLITHKETDYVQAFNFVYEVFNKYFMAEHIQKLIRIKNSDIK